MEHSANPIAEGFLSVGFGHLLLGSRNIEVMKPIRTIGIRVGGDLDRLVPGRCV